SSGVGAKMHTSTVGSSGGFIGGSSEVELLVPGWGRPHASRHGWTGRRVARVVGPSYLREFDAVEPTVSNGDLSRGAMSRTNVSAKLDPADPASWTLIPYDELLAIPLDEVQAAQEAVLIRRF